MVVSKTPPLRIFVGTSPDDAEACVVLEQSTCSRASVPAEFTWLFLSRDPKSLFYSDDAKKAGWRVDHWSTPWTGLRWVVPALCGWRGRAVYFDCPTLVIGDVADLASAEFPRGAAVLARREGSALRTACMVFDCAASRGWLPTLDEARADVVGHQRMGELLSHQRGLVAPLPPGWGMRDADFSRDPASAAGSVHFPSPRAQPHQARVVARLAAAGRQHWAPGMRLPHYCPRLVELYEAEYAAAEKSGLSVEQYVSAMTVETAALG